MDQFTPTFLYIKEHTITGKLYFGKTISNPETYPGSGVVWTRHINKHGKDKIVTLWYCLFLDKQSLTEFATTFSESHNIVESTHWTNLIAENGIDGAPAGRKMPFTTREKIRNSINNRPNFNHLKGIPKSTEWKLTHSSAMKGRSKIRCSCVKCKREITATSLAYHLSGQTCFNPLIINNVTYNTIFDASSNLNCSKDTILYWLRNGRAKRINAS